MTRRGILTGGTWCFDRNKLLDIWPGENGRADILAVETSGGGSGCNLAVDMRKLDPTLPVATIGLIGDDADGHYLLAEADRYGIERTSLKAVPGLQTDYTDAFVSRETGRRTHISFFGASHKLTPDDFDFLPFPHRLLHLGLPGIHAKMDGPWEGDANGWVTTLKKARAAGLKTNMELASIPGEQLAALMRPCLPHLDLLIVNDHEIGGIAGLPTVTEGRTDLEAAKAAVRAVLALGVSEVVATHFPGGSVLAARDGTLIVQPSVQVPAAENAGANGAGDAFSAGFLYGWHEGWSYADALKLAHATAAASLRQTTTYGAVEPWQKCLALARQWGWREPLE